MFRSGQRQSFSADKSQYILHCQCHLLYPVIPVLDLSFYSLLPIFFSTDTANIFYLSAVQQTHLVKSGVIPRLVAIMHQYPENDPLVNVCLLALCNLADMGEKDSRYQALS